MRLVNTYEQITKLQAIKEAEHKFFRYGSNAWGYVVRCIEEAVESVQTIEALEKQNEPIMVDDIQESHYEDYISWYGTCPSCGVELKKTWNPKYCGLCGQVVKWA